MKILPFLHASFPLIINGELHILPVQVFRGASGMTLMRLGDNVIALDEGGRLDGYEMHLDGLTPEQVRGVSERASAAYQTGHNKAPAAPYHQPGTRGHSREVAAWPTKPPAADPVAPRDVGYLIPVAPKADKSN